MDKYVVIRLAGKQYKVSEGMEFLVDKLLDTKKVEPEVLLFAEGKDVRVGKPTLTDLKIKLKVITELEKGEKLEIYKFKAKSRYRKHTGFRPQYTRLLVEKIA